MIRHGETDLNARRVLQRPETALSARGRDQAGRLADHLAGAGITHILSSDLARAQETARALEATTGACFELEPLLQERNFGDLRGTAYADLDEDPFQPGYASSGRRKPGRIFAPRVERAWAADCLGFQKVSTGALAVVTSRPGAASRSRGYHVDPGEAGVEAPDSPLRFRNTSYSVVEGTRAPGRLVSPGPRRPPRRQWTSAIPVKPDLARKSG